MPITGTGDVLGASIKAKVDAYTLTLPPGTPVDRDELYKRIGQAVVEHLVSAPVRLNSVNVNMTTDTVLMTWITTMDAWAKAVGVLPSVLIPNVSVPPTTIKGEIG